MIEKGFRILLGDMPHMEADDAVSKTDIYAKIADDIRSLSINVQDSIAKVLNELAKSHQNHVYLASKRYLNDKGIAHADMGFLGISTRFIGDSLTPCDIVVYAMPEKLKTDDIILCMNRKDNQLQTSFCKVQSIALETGMVEAVHVESKRSVVIGREQVFGKLFDVIPYGTPKWHDSIMKIANKEWLARVIEATLTEYKKAPTPDQSRIKQLEDRLETIKKL